MPWTELREPAACYIIMLSPAFVCAALVLLMAVHKFESRICRCCEATRFWTQLWLQLGQVRKANTVLCCQCALICGCFRSNGVSWDKRTSSECRSQSLKWNEMKWKMGLYEALGSLTSQSSTKQYHTLGIANNKIRRRTHTHTHTIYVNRNNAKRRHSATMTRCS